MTKKGIEIEEPKKLILPASVSEATRDLAIKAMENADDKAIVEALTTGHDLAANVYEFAQGKETVHGLTIVGVTNLWLSVYEKPANAEQLVTSTREDSQSGAPQGAVIHRVAVRVLAPSGAAAWGMIEQPEYMHRRDGSWAWDQHAVAKALSKAERNAMKKLIEPKLAATFMRKCLTKIHEIKKLVGADALEQSANSPVKEARRKRIFAVAAGAFDVSKAANKEKLIAYVEKGIGKALSACTAEELQKVGDELYAFQKQVGKEAFTTAILGQVIQAQEVK